MSMMSTNTAWVTRMLKRTGDKVEDALPDLVRSRLGCKHSARLKPWAGCSCPLQEKHNNISTVTLVATLLIPKANFPTHNLCDQRNS